MALDRRLARWVVEHRVDALDPVFVALSRLGTYGFVWLVLALVAAIAWRRPSVFAWVLAATMSSDLLALAFKALTGRPRPSVTFPEPEPLVTTPLDLSFPSGHAATSFAAAVVFTRYRPRAAPAAFAVCRGDRVVARLRRRSLPARRARGCARRRCRRYSSSAA